MSTKWNVGLTASVTGDSAVHHESPGTPIAPDEVQTMRAARTMTYNEWSVPAQGQNDPEMFLADRTYVARFTSLHRVRIQFPDHD